MEIKANEISKIIQRQIEGYETDVDIREVGIVTSVGDGIVRIYGLDRVMYNELLEFPKDVYGVALNLEEDSVGAVLLGESHLVKEGDIVKRTHRIMQVPAGSAMVGRVVNPLGIPLDKKGPIKTDDYIFVTNYTFSDGDTYGLHYVDRAEYLNVTTETNINTDFVDVYYNNVYDDRTVSIDHIENLGYLLITAGEVSAP